MGVLVFYYYFEVGVLVFILLNALLGISKAIVDKGVMVIGIMKIRLSGIENFSF